MNAWLTAAGVLAGAMNAAVGGGSFVTLPALTFAGVPVLLANASSTVALVPGSAASAWAFRRDIEPVANVKVSWLAVVSMIGGLVGALLLFATPARAFDRLVPWFLLVATIFFAFGKRLGSRLRGTAEARPRTIVLLQLALGVYGGYFGGAVGIMMMAAWSVFTQADLRHMNAAKTTLVGAANVVAAACFIALGQVAWEPTVDVLLGALIGGYVGARVAQRVPPALLRIVISTFNVVMTVLFFVRAYR